MSKYNSEIQNKPTPSVELEIKIQTAEESFTRINCSYTSTSENKEDWRVHIHKDTCLVNESSAAEKLYLLHAINILLAPGWHFFKQQFGTLHFILIFPKLPAHWQRFHLVERDDGCCDEFEVAGINRNSSGIYTVKMD